MDALHSDLEQLYQLREAIYLATKDLETKRKDLQKSFANLAYDGLAVVHCRQCLEKELSAELAKNNRLLFSIHNSSMEKLEQEKNKSTGDN
eukprot:GSA120T00007599001.1